MTRERLRLLIDTDIGTDDAVAILMALRHPGACVEAITTVSGNTDVDQCVRNAHYVLELCGANVPIYRGADRPLIRSARAEADVHGHDGLGDLGLRPRCVTPQPGNAADELVERIRREPGQLTLVTLGPLTNVALALALAPEIARMVKRTVIMGGAANTIGNITPAAEFNIWCDPESARIVFHSGMPITLIPIELCRGHSAHSRVDQEALQRLGTPLADFVVSMCVASTRRRRRRGEPGDAGLPDAVAMAVALEPSSITESARFYTDVETRGELTAGETVVDRLNVWGQPPNLDVGLAIDAARYKRMLTEACRTAP